MSTNAADIVGVVAIGRNEGDRLERCLRSVIEKAAHVVYVDSGSTDGSADRARKLGVEVIELDMSLPFTAARARNTGLEKLGEKMKYVQFVDGDCEVEPGWLDRAVAEFENRLDAVVICGRRRERHPDSSVYNQLCDMEWNTPIGESTFCGGDAMMKLDAVRQVGAFNSSLIAGEEPELCLRLRDAGGAVYRIDEPMTIHDAAMTRFSQWWRRSMRCGHAWAEGARLHGDTKHRHWVRQTWSAWLWGALAPIVIILTAWPTHGWSLLALLVYIALGVRIYRSRRLRGDGVRPSAVYALFCVAAKTPEAIGAAKLSLDRLFGVRSTIIEYKGR